MSTVKDKVLDPAALAKISRLELIARLVVEGYVGGRHKSPFKGLSVEFAEHRQYAVGDDLTDIDWKVYGKSDRYYIKQYEEETNLRCYLVLDASGSMRYARRRGPRDTAPPPTKFRYGCCLAAALGYLMLQQQDAVGLVTFDDQVREYLPARSSSLHLKNLLDRLDQAEPGGETSISTVFHELAERFKRRGLVIIISDLFDDPSVLSAALRHFRHKKHEVIILHVLDEDELTFPFEQWTQFEGLEIPAQKYLVEPQHLRDEYLRQLTAFLDQIRRQCWTHNIDYIPMRTSEPFDTALTSYLFRRASTI